MAKLSTDKIRDLIQGWVGNITEDDLSHIYDPDDFEEGLFDQVMRDFQNSKNWKRHSKATLKDNYADYFLPVCDGIPFPVDFMGEYDVDLCKEMTENNSRAAKCINRIFVPNVDPLQDNFRMEVITTPEDDRVVGWTIFVD